MKTTKNVKDINQGKITNQIKKCSDYDSDCKTIGNPIACFIGGDFTTKCCKENIHFNPADGYCPIIHLKN